MFLKGDDEVTEQEKLLEQQEQTLKRMQKFSVRTTAKKVRTTNTVLRLLIIILVLIILLMSISWACARFVNSTGFTVSLNRDSKGLSLYDNGNGDNPTIRLNAEPVENFWNISVRDLPANLGSVYGSQNGYDEMGKSLYICYTFALGNDTKEDICYDSSVTLDDQNKDADNAIRVRVIRNDQKKDYAKAAVKGGTEKVAVDATWIDPKTVMKEESSIIKSGEKVKYTVVIWLEGDDPECVDDILGGEVKLSMHFNVIDDKAGNGELV